MKRYKFIIADVFTDTPFGGNQLAVFTDRRGLSTEIMQKLAREMNYSETTFILPPNSAGADFHIRIFTPAIEIPFAGHPIVGTGYVIGATGMIKAAEPPSILKLETGVGIISVQLQIENGAIGRVTMTQPNPVSRGAFDNYADIADALGISASDIESGLPVEAIYNGLTVLIVPVSSLKAIESIKVNLVKLERVAQAVGATTVLAFSQEVLNAASTVHCRVFAPGAGVMEDPATGSANGPLGYYLVKHRLVKPEPTTKIISEQGYEIFRPSTLYIEVDTSGDEITAVRVAGDVRIVGEGEMFV